jgi:flagella basal body P-ring formation protein FlgA
MVDSVFPLSLTASRMARALVRAGVGWLVAASASTVWAEDLADISNQWLQGALAQTEAQQSMPLRMEVQVGKLDPRLNLAPCLRVEPYLPSGSKLWGRTRIGMRCVEGAKPWNVFMPVTIRAFGPAWVLVNNVSMGEVLTHEHAMQSEVDWAESPHSIIALPDDWVGQTAARNLTAGMALRQTMVKAPEIFKPGAGVKVVVQGSGFAVTSSGKALESGSAGQNVRVRMENGRTVIGTVNQQGEVVVAQ